ncbi:MAG: OmpA family protein [Bacteroidota bacterium]|nr:OmpA family protein [Bacteroidota bacterium]
MDNRPFAYKPVLIAFFLFLTSWQNGLTQLHTNSRSALKHYNIAVESYQFVDYEKAAYELEIALKQDPEFIEAHLLRAELNTDMKRFDIAIQAYREVIRLDPEFYVNAFFNLGHLEVLSGEYILGRENLEIFLTKQGISKSLISRAKKDIRTCDFAIQAMKNPVSFNPVKLGEEINSEYDDYWPSVTADDKTLVITRLEPSDPFSLSKDRMNENFYMSHRENGAWVKSYKLASPVNTDRNEGAQSLTADGNFMYFTACNRADGLGSCDLYVSSRLKGKWLVPANMGTPVNSKSWEAQPSIAPDGRTLYFASNRPGGKGKMDIWFSRLEPDGKWSEAQNLGDSVNTSGNEMSPYIHKDNKTLYFSSDGWTGMGGFDLFITKMKSDSIRTHPENLGYPINTWSDEIGMVLTARGDIAYYSSAKEKESGKDIYMFEIPEELRPEPVSYIEGKVFDINSKKSLIARFELIDLESNKNVFRAFSDYKGKFLVTLPTNKNYALNVSRDGYLFYSANFSLKGIASLEEPYHLVVPLSPIKTGERTVLRNIFFNFNSYELLPESIVELGKLLEFLQENQELKIRIEGHTDSEGDIDYNLNLSEKRAKTVMDYLLWKSISSNRLSYKGYGESSPISDNSSDQGRAQNRRIEIVVVE